MMAKWSRGTSGQQTTSMTSPVVSQTNRPCSMSFFYYFNSDDISLAVYVLTLNLVQQNRIWYKPGNGATNGWESSGVLDLSQFSSGGRFQVQIRAQMKPGFAFGKVASVDDVLFYGCDCSTPPCTVPAVINTPSPSSSVSTTVTSAVPVVSEPDLGLGAPCTFDGFDCGYSVAWSSANYKWQRTGANKGMPNYDHTVGSVVGSQGQFMYAYWANGMPNSERTTIQSPAISGTTGPCYMKFYYYFNNADGVQLSVSLTTIPVGQVYQVWSSTSTRFDTWKSSNAIDISQYSSLGDFTVTIETTLPDVFLHGKAVSIDDIVFLGCRCSSPVCIGKVTPTVDVPTTTPKETLVKTNSTQVASPTLTSSADKTHRSTKAPVHIVIKPGARRTEENVGQALDVPVPAIVGIVMGTLLFVILVLVIVIIVIRSRLVFYSKEEPIVHYSKEGDDYENNGRVYGGLNEPHLNLQIGKDYDQENGHAPKTIENQLYFDVNLADQSIS
ncbi:MAM and LDL-receptor class A domain-containing protein 2-like [Lingula anatina]|uniref:MAM and LDL-receptor class A domain-containing protein 2-like n=1 Tax=Lingula anatina TaxID=7574 RepID=A0A1S3JGE8_LINAN|nr:MAM and LDL-receptor class A domain-containing protein 2-like [Lingula anatina]|eukprot:XP_013409472.1 MAM and LDL-receptor class A domain-containing protein 2-like [Lingula anatina]